MGWFANLSLKWKGWRTIIFARLLVVLGLMSTVFLAITPDQIAVFLPDHYKIFAPLVVSLIGVLVELLRRITDTPVGTNTNA